MAEYKYRNIITGEIFINDRPIDTLNEQWVPHSSDSNEHSE